LLGFGLRGSYVGTQGRNLSYSLNINIPEPSLIPFNVLDKWSNDAVGSVIWTVPVGQGKRYLGSMPKVLDAAIGNWRIYTLSYVGSGLFFSPSNTGVNGGLPDLVGDPNAIARSKNLWFDPKAFAVPAAGRFGNALPNSLESQPLNVHHLSLIRKFTILDRLSFTLTAAISNLFNHATFNDPPANISVASVGAFTSTAGVFSSNERGAYRQMTLKGRFDF
jgi:hypothetical protein